MSSSFALSTFFSRRRGAAPAPIPTLAAAFDKLVAAGEGAWFWAAVRGSRSRPGAPLAEDEAAGLGWTSDDGDEPNENQSQLRQRFHRRCRRSYRYQNGVMLTASYLLSTVLRLELCWRAQERLSV